MASTATADRHGAVGGSTGRPSAPAARRALRCPPAGRNTRAFAAVAVIVVLLSLLGLVMVVLSATVTSLEATGDPFFHAKRHALWLCLGMAACVVTLRIDYQRWRAPLLTTGALIVTLAALASLLVPSPLVLVGNGSARWLRLGGLVVQPSEAAKLALVLFAASLLSRRLDRVASIRQTVLPLLLVFGAMAGLILAQPSLGTVLILAGILLVMLFLAGLPTRHVAALIALGAVAAVLFSFQFGYRRQRLASYFDPWADPYGAGYQALQAQVGIAAGGLTGVGPGGARSNLAYVPYAHTDFIFVTIAENLGFIGALAVVGLFLCLGFVGIRVVRDAPDPYGALLAAGISGWFVLQAFTNIAVAQSLLPTLGVTLPFVSYGGSSLIVNLAAVGILMNVARQGHRP
ncbi:MAG: putative peptidoglycan glycosyltransferase FtsW [bacterium]|nr:putative peptidoglycan glycosyltransferase FtsW [bacterium]MDE0667655.1 putative peptidoglycan glycosyltransferase FtsW [bacterium]MYB23755.1 cell division protein FtsW [Acidimicrobiia bacterium]